MPENSPEYTDDSNASCFHLASRSALHCKQSSASDPDVNDKHVQVCRMGEIDQWSDRV